MWKAVLIILALAIPGAFVAGCYLLQMDKWKARQKKSTPGLTEFECTCAECKGDKETF